MRLNIEGIYIINRSIRILLLYNTRYEVITNYH